MGHRSCERGARFVGAHSAGHGFELGALVVKFDEADVEACHRAYLTDLSVGLPLPSDPCLYRGERLDASLPSD